MNSILIAIPFSQTFLHIFASEASIYTLTRDEQRAGICGKHEQSERLWLTDLAGKKGFKDVQFTRYGEMNSFKDGAFLGLSSDTQYPTKAMGIRCVLKGKLAVWTATYITTLTLREHCALQRIHINLINQCPKAELHY